MTLCCNGHPAYGRQFAAISRRGAKCATVRMVLYRSPHVLQVAHFADTSKDHAGVGAHVNDVGAHGTDSSRGSSALPEPIAHKSNKPTRISPNRIASVDNNCQGSRGGACPESHGFDLVRARTSGISSTARAARMPLMLP